MLPELNKNSFVSKKCLEKNIDGDLKYMFKSLKMFYKEPLIN